VAPRETQKPRPVRSQAGLLYVYGRLRCGIPRQRFALAATARTRRHEAVRVEPAPGRVEPHARCWSWLATRLAEAVIRLDAHLVGPERLRGHLTVVVRASDVTTTRTRRTRVLRRRERSPGRTPGRSDGSSRGHLLRVLEEAVARYRTVVNHVAVRTIVLRLQRHLELV
jgi:hypothetical protein